MRTFPLILRVALLITSVGFVSMGCTPREHVRIVREIELSSQRVSPYVIIRAPGGGYVITGSNGFADAAGWAMRIDARGRKLWEVVDGDLAISGDTKASINRFNGAALL